MRRSVPLPPEGIGWDARECNLWFQTNGQFHPRKATGEHRQAAREAEVCKGGVFGFNGREGRVSVVVPTTEDRHKFHLRLWECFNAQTWPDKELVVVETFHKECSEFLMQQAKRDRRLTYVKYQVEPQADWSIGVKRNICAHLATGQFLAHFDDDDLYAPKYLSTMVENIKKSRALAIKLSRWYVFDTKDNSCYFCDPLSFEHDSVSAEQWILSQFMTLSTMPNIQDEQTLRGTYGYGFSYLYFRSAVLELPFEDVNMGEDFSFYSALMRAKGSHCVALLEDASGICLHMQHGSNTSNSSCVASRHVLHEEAADLDVSDLWVQPRVRRAAQVEDDVEAPSRRYRRLTVHVLGKHVQVMCPAGATASEVLAGLQEQHGDLPNAEVYRAPTAGQVSEAELQELLQAAVRMVSPGTVLPANVTDPSRQFGGDLGRALARARGAVARTERVGACISEVWVSQPKMRTEPIVRVECEATADPNNPLRTFHLILPVDADVAEVRELLGSGLPSDALVLAERTGRGVVVLHDAELTPAVLTVSAFHGPVLPLMVFPKHVARKVQDKLLEFAMSEDVQRRANFMMKQADGRDQVYRVLLSNFLNKEIYPEVMRPWGLLALPAMMILMPVFFEATEVHQLTKDVAFTKKWRQIEELLQNKEAVDFANHHLDAAFVLKEQGQAHLRDMGRHLHAACLELPALPAAESKRSSILELKDPDTQVRNRWHLGCAARQVTCSFWLLLHEGQVPETCSARICETSSSKDHAGKFSIQVSGVARSSPLRLVLLGNLADTASDECFELEGSVITFETDLADGGWHHVAVVYDADSATGDLHVDGSLVERHHYSFAQAVRLTEVQIAPRHPLHGPDGCRNLRWSKGHLWDVRLWVRSLGSQEVQDLWHHGRQELPKVSARAPSRPLQ